MFCCVDDHIILRYRLSTNNNMWGISSPYDVLSSGSATDCMVVFNAEKQQKRKDNEMHSVVRPISVELFHFLSVSY